MENRRGKDKGVENKSGTLCSEVKKSAFQYVPSLRMKHAIND